MRMQIILDAMTEDEAKEAINGIVNKHGLAFIFGSLRAAIEQANDVDMNHRMEPYIRPLGELEKAARNDAL